MPSLKTSRFTAYEFTPQEYKSAAVLNPMQKMHILTKQCEVAESLMNLEASTDEEIRSLEIQRAYLKGQMAMCSHLLEISESMEINIREEESSHDFEVNRPPQDGNLFTNNPSDGE